MMVRTVFLLAFFGLCASPSFVFGQVKAASANGFHIEIVRDLDCDAAAAYEKFVSGFNKWYDVSHSYSQKPENFSLDLEKHCMLEKLDDGGFVRHMEIVFHQPGKTLRMTGGLGPLQEMGVAGALTFSFADRKVGSQLKMTYHVSGGDHLRLDKIADIVAQVLGSQLDAFKSFCKKT